MTKYHHEHALLKLLCVRCVKIQVTKAVETIVSHDITGHYPYIYIIVLIAEQYITEK